VTLCGRGVIGKARLAERLVAQLAQACPERERGIFTHPGRRDRG
jgi:hypothetical protein